MLYATYKDEAHKGMTHDKRWHIGTKFDTWDQSLERLKLLVEVQADGDELDFISVQYSNIPMVARNRIVRWFGDDAKFIVANLPSK